MGTIQSIIYSRTIKPMHGTAHALLNPNQCLSLLLCNTVTFDLQIPRMDCMI